MEEAALPLNEEGEEEADKEEDPNVDPDQASIGLASSARALKPAPVLQLGSLQNMTANAAANKKRKVASKVKNPASTEPEEGAEDAEETPLWEIPDEDEDEVPKDGPRSQWRLRTIMDSLQVSSPCFEGLVPAKIFGAHEKPGRQLAGVWALVDDLAGYNRLQYLTQGHGICVCYSATCDLFACCCCCWSYSLGACLLLAASLYL